VTLSAKPGSAFMQWTPFNQRLKEASEAAAASATLSGKYTALNQ